MRKSALTSFMPALLGFVAAASLTATASAETSYNGPCQAVFLVPHQDDEVLSMGAAIRHQVETSGPETACVALFTTGVSSVTQAVIRGTSIGDTSFRGWIPASDSQATGNIAAFPNLSDLEFVRARDREFVDALSALGVPHTNVYLNRFTVDGKRHPGATPHTIPGVSRVADAATPSQEQQKNAKAFINAAVNYFGPDKVYRTQSPHDVSPDHAALGIALRSADLPAGSKRYYYPPYQLSLLQHEPSELTVEVAEDTGALRAAANAYGMHNPQSGRYGIGWLSVPQAFGGEALGVQKCRALPHGNTLCEPTPPFPSHGPDIPFIGQYRSLSHE